MAELIGKTKVRILNSLGYLKVQCLIGNISILLSTRTLNDFSDYYDSIVKYSRKFKFTTFGNDQSAIEIIRMLLRENHIAFGTMIDDAHSLYRWMGEIAEAAKVVVLLKTDGIHLEQCLGRLNDLHPYEVPEIVTVDPFLVSEPYSKWIRESLSRAE